MIFSEINANRLIKIDEAGTFSTFLENTGGTTGLQFDRQGRLIAAVGGIYLTDSANAQPRPAEPLPLPAAFYYLRLAPHNRKPNAAGVPHSGADRKRFHTSANSGA